MGRVLRRRKKGSQGYSKRFEHLCLRRWGVPPEIGALREKHDIREKGL